MRNDLIIRKEEPLSFTSVPSQQQATNFKYTIIEVRVKSFDLAEHWNASVCTLHFSDRTVHEQRKQMRNFLNWSRMMQETKPIFIDAEI